MYEVYKTHGTVPGVSQGFEEWELLLWLSWLQILTPYLSLCMCVCMSVHCLDIGFLRKQTAMGYSMSNQTKSVALSSQLDVIEIS